MKNLFILILFFTLSFHLKAQSPTVSIKGTLELTDGVGEPYGLGGTYSISVNDMIYSRDLSFIGRQVSDDSYLNINTDVMTIQHIRIPGSFFIFNHNNNPVQWIYETKYANRPGNQSEYDSIFMYDFKIQKVVGALAIKKEGIDNVKFLTDDSGILDVDGQNNTLVVQILKPGNESRFIGVTLNPVANGDGVVSFEKYVPSSWQTIDPLTAKALFSISMNTTETYTSGAGSDQDKNRQIVRLRSVKSIYWDLKENKEIKYTGNIDQQGFLSSNGKLLSTVTESETVNGSTNYYTCIQIYNLKENIVEKKITLPNKNQYEVFFSEGKYAMFYDKYPDVAKLSPMLIDLETETITEIPFPNPLDPLVNGKKKWKKSLAAFCVNANVIYSIEEAIFSDDLTKMIITSYVDYSNAGNSINYTVGGKRTYKQEYIDVFEIKN